MHNYNVSIHNSSGAITSESNRWPIFPRGLKAETCVSKSTEPHYWRCRSSSRNPLRVSLVLPCTPVGLHGRQVSPRSCCLVHLGPCSIALFFTNRHASSIASLMDLVNRTTQTSTPGKLVMEPAVQPSKFRFKKSQYLNRYGT